MPTPQHRSPTSNSLKKEADEPNKLKDKKASKKEAGLKTTADTKEATKEEGESEKRGEKKKEKKEKGKKEKSSKKKSSAQKNDSIDLLISIDANNHKRSESDYNELLSPEHEHVPTVNSNSNEDAMNAKVAKVTTQKFIQLFLIFN